MKSVVGLLFVCVLVVGVQSADWTNIKTRGVEVTPRYHHSFAYVNEKVGVLVGGIFFEPTTYLSDAKIYNFINNEWTDAADSGFPRAYFTASVYNNSVIVYGGQKPPQGTVPLGAYNDTQRYHIDSDTWSTDETNTLRITLPGGGWYDALARQWHGGDVIGDVLYVVGGYSWAAQNTLNDVIGYNLRTKTWSFHFNNTASGAAVPPTRQGHTVHAWKDPVRGESLVVFGGYSANPQTSGYNDVWQYFVNTREWVKITPAGEAPAGRYGHSSAIFNNTIFYYGGLSTEWGNPSKDTYYGDVWALQLKGNGGASWVNVYPNSGGSQPSPGIRQSPTSTFVYEKFYVFSGYQAYAGLRNDTWTIPV